MTSTKAPRTVSDFRAAHDPNVIIPNKIRTTLDAMLKEGKEHWEYESDFIKRAGLSQTHLSQFREQFADHVVETPHTNGRGPRRVWFASKAVAKAMRGG